MMGLTRASLRGVALAVLPTLVEAKFGSLAALGRISPFLQECEKKEDGEEECSSGLGGVIIFWLLISLCACCLLRLLYECLCGKEKRKRVDDANDAASDPLVASAHGDSPRPHPLYDDQVQAPMDYPPAGHYYPPAQPAYNAHPMPQQYDTNVTMEEVESVDVASEYETTPLNPPTRIWHSEPAAESSEMAGSVREAV